MVLGIDGLDPRAVDLLMSEGRLPNLARMRLDGAYGTLRADPPLLSPVLWTTIATGRPPTEHGIGHFVAHDPATGALQPVTSSMRRVRALWNIASDSGLRSVVVGWWGTWPPEPINGAVVSDRTCYHFLFDQEAGDGTGPAAITHPQSLAARIAPLVRRPDRVGLDEARRFVDVSAAELEHSFDFADDVSHFRWALSAAYTSRDVGLALWGEMDPELLLVYVEGTDTVSHLFGHLFRAQGLAGELVEQQRRFGRTVEEMYVVADELVGRFLAAMDGRTTLLVLSDHGFRLGDLHDDPSRTRDLRRVTERYHAEQGVLYMFGNQVRRHARLDEARQLDVAPTVLALLGLEVIRDMPGRVLEEGLDLERPVTTGAGAPEGTRPDGAAPVDPRLDRQVLARLESLGYAQAGPASPESERNLAALAFEAGHYEEAAATYRRLLAAQPDQPSLHTSLAGCLGAMGRYDEALDELERALELDPLSAEAYHNRGVIHERRGDLEAALEDYRSAVRYAPDYQPSIRALVRLTGSGAVRVPADAVEREAQRLADQAGELARRGDYGGALRLLEEAERLAPGYVLVYQYQSNAAYLAGDLERAERALLKALELEPGNQLFRANLEQIRRLAGQGQAQAP